MDEEFQFALEDALNEYDVTDEGREVMERRVKGSWLVELMESFSRSTDTVEYAYASENVPDGLWGATLRSSRSKEGALAAWKQWLAEKDWFPLVA